MEEMEEEKGEKDEEEEEVTNFISMRCRGESM